MELTKEMQDLLKTHMSVFLKRYWEKHATAEQKIKAEGKTFEGAYKFIESVAKSVRSGGVVAMPDDLAYWLLMEYMENLKEGDLYTGKSIVSQEKPKESKKTAKKSANDTAKKIAEKVAAVQMDFFGGLENA